MTAEIMQSSSMGNLLMRISKYISFVQIKD